MTIFEMGEFIGKGFMIVIILNSAHLLSLVSGKLLSSSVKFCFKSIPKVILLGDHTHAISNMARGHFLELQNSPIFGAPFIIVDAMGIHTTKIGIGFVI